MQANAAITRVLNASVRRLALAAALILSSAPLPEAQAQQTILCGGIYRVAPGDTLHRIATRAYGQGDYMTLFEANRDILPEVSQIEVGDELFIPCRDGTGPRTRAEALASGARPSGSVAPPAEATAAAVRPADGGIGLLTGSDFAPFAHRALPEGGMITELVRLSIASAAPERAVNIAFVDDWPSHLEMLDAGAYDLGFPWYRPDCGRTERLSGPMRARCARLDFSEPLFEVAMGYYVRAADPLAGAVQYSQLFGRRICRPAGYFTFDLDQENLREPKVSRVIASSAKDCFTWLTQGDVDVVTLSSPIAAAEITRLGLDGRVAEIPGLASAQTLHAVAKKDDPGGRVYLDLVNAGLADLRGSGRWFEVVSRHLGAFGMPVR